MEYREFDKNSEEKKLMALLANSFCREFDSRKKIEGNIVWKRAGGRILSSETQEVQPVILEEIGFIIGLTRYFYTSGRICLSKFRGWESDLIHLVRKKMGK